jgi:hypothetical protein
MQYLMVLLVSAGVFLLMTAVVLGVSYALGALMRSHDGGKVSPTGADPCAQFQADRDWYEAQPIWKRSVITAWWLTNRYLCATRGCD